MQSKTAFVLLGLLKEKPLNPYEIVKVLERINISRWSPVSASAVYMTIKVLEKKGLIAGRREKTGAMPEKTVYAVTDAGTGEFMQSLRAYLTEEISDLAHFNLATLFICHLERQEAVEVLSARLARLDAEDEGTGRAYDYYRARDGAPEYALVSLRRNRAHYQAEKQITEFLVQEILGADRWGHYLTKGL